MTKIKSHKQFIICAYTEREQLTNGGYAFAAVLKDEAEHGLKFANSECDFDTLQSAIEFIDCY